MPKVVIDNTKGLIQEEGSGIVVKNALSFSSTGGFLRPVETITGTVNLLENEDSGKILFCDANAAAVAIQLPAIQDTSAGWFIRVVSTEAISNAHTLVVQTSNSLENKLAGSAIMLNRDSGAAAAISSGYGTSNDNTITFLRSATDNSACEAAYVDIYSDGLFFYFHAFAVCDGQTNVITVA